MPPGGIAMIEATSCGGVVIFRGKILLLYKNYNNKFDIADLITKIQQQNPKNEEILVNTILELSISGKNQNLAPYSKEALDEVLQTYEIAVNKKNMDKTLSQNTFGKSPREKASIYDQYKKQQIR